MIPHWGVSRTAPVSDEPASIAKAMFRQRELTTQRMHTAQSLRDTTAPGAPCRGSGTGKEPHEQAPAGHVCAQPSKRLPAARTEFGTAGQPER